MPSLSVVLFYVASLLHSAQCRRPLTEDSYFTAKHAVHGPSHYPTVNIRHVYINQDEEQGLLQVCHFQEFEQRLKEIF